MSLIFRFCDTWRLKRRTFIIVSLSKVGLMELSMIRELLQSVKEFWLDRDIPCLHVDKDIRAKQ